MLDLCYDNFRSKNALTMKDQIIENLTEQLKNDPENKQLKEQLQKEMQSKKNLFPYLSSQEQSNYIREYRENLMDNIDNDDVKSSIAKEYNSFRSNNPDTDIISLLDEMKAISDRQKLLKNIDQEANFLVDTVKNQMMDLSQQ